MILIDSAMGVTWSSTTCLSSLGMEGWTEDGGFSIERLDVYEPLSWGIFSTYFFHCTKAYTKGLWAGAVRWRWNSLYGCCVTGRRITESIRYKPQIKLSYLLGSSMWHLWDCHKVKVLVGYTVHHPTNPSSDIYHRSASILHWLLRWVDCTNDVGNLLLLYFFRCCPDMGLDTNWCIYWDIKDRDVIAWLCLQHSILGQSRCIGWEFSMGGGLGADHETNQWQDALIWHPTPKTGYGCHTKGASLRDHCFTAPSLVSGFFIGKMKE